MAKTHVNRQIVGNQGWIPTVIATNDQYHSYSLPQLTTTEFLKESGKPQAWFIAKFGTTKTVRSKTPSHMHTLKTNNLHDLHATGTNSQGQVTYNNITRSDYQRGENTSWTFTITKMINTLCGQDFNLKRVVVVLSSQCQRYKEINGLQRLWKCSFWIFSLHSRGFALQAKVLWSLTMSRWWVCWLSSFSPRLYWLHAYYNSKITTKKCLSLLNWEASSRACLTAKLGSKQHSLWQLLLQQKDAVRKNPGTTKNQFSK